MKKSFTKGLIAFGFCATVVGFVACGDESSSGPSKNEETGIETEVSSSSENDEAISSSSAKDEASSSSKKVESSSSTEASSSSTKNKESSSSGKVESSSSKNEVSSSSKNVRSSSSAKSVETSSSETKPVETSSSESSSSGIVTQNSSSSSENPGPIENSSSSEESSSSVIETSSSSLVATGVCKTRIEDNCIYGTLYDDRDGKTYKTVKIGEQEWMAQSLNFEITDVANSTIRSYCPMDSDSCSKYGRYYTWSAAIDSIYLYEKKSIKCGYKIKCDLANRTVEGVCPDGWHIPNQSEWDSLITFVGREKAGNLLKSFDGWVTWSGDDAYGFSALAAGYVGDRKYHDKGNTLSFWIALDNDQYSAKVAVFNYSQTRKDEVLIQSKTKDSGSALTVRCIKN